MYRWGWAGRIPDRSDCQIPAFLFFDVVAQDDRTPFERLRFRVQALRGNAPPYFYDEPVSGLWFLWEDDPEESLDFALRVRVLDEAGNESPPVDVEVQDLVAHAEGCGVAPATSVSMSVWPWLLLAWGWRARRR